MLQPHFVVVGSGAWNDIDAIAGACAPTLPLIIMRDMNEDLIDQVPEVVMDKMAQVAAQRWYKRVAFHLLNEQYNDVPKAKSWELRAITFAQAPTVALNLSYGKDPDPRFREVADASTYIGPHLYDGFIEEKQQWVDRIYTSRRYAGNWLADYTYKYIATEVGIEAFPATGQRRGWHDMGIPEETVRLRMLANSLHWKADGLLGVAWFTAGHTEASWNEGYGMTEGMAKSWGLQAPQPNHDGAQPPIDNGGGQMAGLTEAEYNQALPKIDSIYGDLNDFDGFESSNDILIPAKVGYLEQQKRTVQNMRKNLLEIKALIAPK